MHFAGISPFLPTATNTAYISKIPPRAPGEDTSQEWLVHFSEQRKVEERDTDRSQRRGMTWSQTWTYNFVDAFTQRDHKLSVHSLLYVLNNN